MASPDETIPAPSQAPAAAEAEAAKPIPGGLALWKPSLAVLLVVLAVDHATKIWAKAVLEPMLANPGRHAIPVLPGFFELQYGENTGAAFSILSGQAGLLAVISLVAVAGLLWWWKLMPAGEWAGRLSVAAVIGGAIGNMIDRAARGYVVDMFHAYYQQWSWPIFNVADSFICVGMAVLMWRVWRGKI